MSAPKKGKDLSALKARLAKKTEAEGGGEAAAPSEVETQAAPIEVPPPGEVAPPPRRAAAADAAPFGGGVHFDPNAGVLEDSGGDVAPRRSAGLVLVAALAAMGLGVGGGWLLQKGVDTRARVQSAREKGDEMYNEVVRMKDARARVSLKLEEVKAAVQEDPDKGAQVLTDLLTESFGGEQPTAEKLFGWQLASMHPKSINSVFGLYIRYTALQMSLIELASHVNTNAQALREAAGPGRFAVLYKNEGGLLVEYVQPICDVEAKEPCEEGSEAEAAGYEIRENLGGPTAVVAKDQAAPLLNEGGMFKYAFGDEPQRNAIFKYSRLLAAVETQLEEMSKVEKRALESLEQYAKNPTVDASSAQPDPGD